MLYQPKPLDFSREVLVFVHIPKTAGTSLLETLTHQLGEHRCRGLPRFQKFGNIHPNRFLKMHYMAQKFLTRTTLRLCGIEPYLRDDGRNFDLSTLYFMSGHFKRGIEPHTGRRPVYITLLRDPVDRFVSDYYYRFDARARTPEVKPDRHAFWQYDIDRFVDYVYSRKSWTPTNLQCLYLGLKDNFEAARRAVEEHIFLAAPVPRTEGFLELLSQSLNLPPPPPHRSNVGRARQGKQPPSEKSLAKIREMVSDDQRLYDYVAKSFDELYAEFSQSASIKEVRHS
jgi:hypothetical protein